MVKNNKKKQKSKKNKIGLKVWFYILLMAALSVMFLSMAVLLFVGMLPTLVAFVVDRVPGKSKTVTIGSMNFAGCFPYLLLMVVRPDNLDIAFQYLSDPMTIIVIYGAAAIGYIIHWSVTLGVSEALMQKSKRRIEKIEEQKKKLEERWGKKVNGQYTLDPYGFPVEGVMGGVANEDKKEAQS